MNRQTNERTTYPLFIGAIVIFILLVVLMKLT